MRRLIVGHPDDRRPGLELVELVVQLGDVGVERQVGVEDDEAGEGVGEGPVAAGRPF